MTSLTDPQRAVLYRRDDLPVDQPMPLITRRRVIGEQMMVSDIELERGFKVPTHAHENEQIAMVLSGRLLFGLGADDSADRREIIVEAGGILHLPSNVPHSAEALEDTHVIDLFSPPSETTGVDQH